MALNLGTPGAVDFRRKLAEMMASQGLDSSPIQSPWQGLDRMAKALLAGWQMQNQAAEEKQHSDAVKGIAQAYLSGGQAPATTPTPAINPPQAASADPASVPSVDATTVNARMPRGLRNNNPLNIEAGRFTQGQPGFSGSDGRFARFETAQQGIDAASNLLDIYGRQHGINTVAGVINRWAPASDGNPVSAYAASVSKALGVGPNDPINLADPAIRQRLVAAMGQFENGMPIPQMATSAQRGPQLAQAGGQPQVGSNIPPQIRAIAERYLAHPNPRVQQLGLSIIEPYMKPGDPTYGVIGKDQYGNETYGWRDPKSRAVTPVQGPGIGQPQGGDQAVPPPPPGVDPVLWRKTQTERYVKDALPASSDDTSKLRKEIQDLPSYKNIAQAAPVYKSMLSAAGRDNRAADVNLIYGMAKIMDPGSVVRESEMTIAQAVANLPQALQAQIMSQLNATGRLSPEVRQAIMQEAHSRLQAYHGMFEQDSAMYRGIAERNRMRTEDVLPKFGPFQEFKLPAPASSDTRLEASPVGAGAGVADAAQAPPPSNAPIIVNPKTGERMILRNGKWVPFT